MAPAAPRKKPVSQDPLTLSLSPKGRGNAFPKAAA
jgi:hypothetical protein